jgi:RNA polymerase sigma-70 factor (ECF subfamily)
VAADPALESVLPGLAGSGMCRQEDLQLSGGPAAGRLGLHAWELSAEIVSRARAGDPEAFCDIFQRYSKPILAFIFHLLGDKSRAEELTQEAFFRAFRGIGRFQESARLSTWLFGIARNVAWEAIRTQRRSLREVVLDDSISHTLHDDRAGPGESILTAELQRAIRRSLQGLSDDQRIVFVLKMLYRMHYRQISQITGSSIGKLKTDLLRARQQMRKRLQPYLAGGGFRNAR